ncbi:Ankyrin_repeats-containing protein [Hexamita inflata]|uniref:Ankyrin repeats-containing protein n=1 Tax=Hexamita inflata TaxID=28002 RepID=A0AA86NSU8_9EUKA|nr:Ankyrin repeats-containing protein [Hexamita inflata]
MDQTERCFACVYPEGIYYYTKSRIYLCDVQDNILAEQEHNISALQNWTKSYYHDYCQYFITFPYKDSYLSNVDASIIEFSRFSVTVKLELKDFTGYRDRIFNKMTKINDTFYVTNGTCLYILDPENNSLQFIKNFKTNNLRLYNLFEQLVVRNVHDNRFYILTDAGFNYQFSFEDFNLMFACKQYLIGFTKVQGEKQTCMVTIRNSQLISKILNEFSELVIESGKQGLSISQDQFLKLTGLTTQRINEQSEQEIQLIEEYKKELIELGFENQSNRIVTNINYFRFLKGKEELEKQLIPHHILKYAFDQPEKLLKAVQQSEKLMTCELALKIVEIEPKCNQYIIFDPKDSYFKQIRHDKNIHYAQLLNKYFEIPKSYFRDELFHVLDDNFFYCQQEFIQKLPKSTQIDLFKCAAFNGQLKVVNIFKQLLKPDDIPNTNRPLQHAIRSCAHECVQALMEYQTNTKLNYESTELIEATRTQTDISQFLHQVKLKDYNGKTALMHAVEVQSYELVRILAQYECLQRDRKGETALMKTVDNEFYPAIDLLKDEMGCADNKGLCALSIALALPSPTWVIQKLFDKEHRHISISEYKEDFALQFKQRRDLFNSSLELKMVASGTYKYSAHVDHFQKRAEHMLALSGKLQNKNLVEVFGRNVKEYQQFSNLIHQKYERYDAKDNDEYSDEEDWNRDDADEHRRAIVLMGGRQQMQLPPNFGRDEEHFVEYEDYEDSDE